MKKMFHLSIVCSALLALSQSTAPAAAEKPEANNESPGRMASLLVSVTARIESIDAGKREVTLKGPLGNEETFVVDKRVKRFNEFKVGDNVTANYYVSLAAELRKPTPEEMKNPFMGLDAAGKAPEDAPPEVAGLRRYKVVTTVEGIDRPTQTLTLKGPLEHYHTVRVKDPSALTKLRIGDNIMVTYTEALAISLEKAAEQSSE
jgi:Cu/Ag efflux protein CusF